MAVSAVIFDMDGVLIETESVWDEVRKKFTLERGGRWRDDAQQRMMGMSSKEWTRFMIDELHVDMSADDISHGMVERLLKRYAEDLPVLPGAVESVRALSTLWPMAVASSSNKELIVGVLEMLDIASCFVDTVSSEEVSAGKPNPAVYLEAARRIGVEPAECLAIEDSSNGLKAANAAGMQVVAVPNSEYPPSADSLSLVVAELKTLEQLTPEFVQAL